MKSDTTALSDRKPSMMRVANTMSVRCETCGQKIASREAGWLETWADSNGQLVKFRTVHHVTASPKPGGDCYSADATGGEHLTDDNGLDYVVSQAASAHKAQAIVDRIRKL